MTCGSRRRHLAPSLTRSKNCVAWHYIVRILRTLKSVRHGLSAYFSRRLAIRLSRCGRFRSCDRLDDIQTRRGDGRARTGDPLLAKQVLSQLSYIPEVWRKSRAGSERGPFWIRTRDLTVISRALSPTELKAHPRAGAAGPRPLKRGATSTRPAWGLEFSPEAPRS